MRPLACHATQTTAASDSPLPPPTAGKPKTITGFVTNTTPVLLGYGERAQLASEDYEPLTPLLEGFVIVKKNKEATTDEKK